MRKFLSFYIMTSVLAALMFFAVACGDDDIEGGGVDSADCTQHTWDECILHEEKVQTSILEDIREQGYND